MEDKAGDNQSIRTEEIGRLIREFQDKFEAGTRDPDHFLNIGEIESLWGELQGKTNNIYSDMLRELMNQVEERDLIRKKKDNIETRE